MGLFRGVLLGTGAALVSIGAAQAADLPSRKAAPVEYVRVCDAYGAGFFFIPGTQTCLRIGGRVRADYAFSGRDDIYSGGTINGTTGALVDTISSLGSVQSTHGFEARGRINIDARTQTAWGTVQAAAQLRMARTTGVLQSTNGNPTSDSGSTGSTLESAFIRFAGFTFGISRDNFASMPSLTYGAGHWAAFGNGAMQLMYTHTFGGGLSATVGIQDRSYTTAGGTALTGTTAIQSNYEGLPQFNARLDWAQSWGEIALTAAVGEARGVTSASSAAFDDRETVWAVGGALKLNLPMLASGSALWLTGAYADGMTEYTTNFTSVKTSDTRRNVGGYTSTHPSWVYSGTEIQTYTSWNVAALLQHFWTPQWRSVAWASYGQINAPAGVAALPFNASAPADATVWNIGKQIAWLPTRDFEIGLEVIYSRVDQDVGRTLVAGTGGSVCAAGSTACFTREHSGNFTGRLRVERNF